MIPSTRYLSHTLPTLVSFFLISSLSDIGSICSISVLCTKLIEKADPNRTTIHWRIPEVTIKNINKSRPNQWMGLYLKLSFSLLK